MYTYNLANEQFENAIFKAFLQKQKIFGTLSLRASQLRFSIIMNRFDLAKKYIFGVTSGPDDTIEKHIVIELFSFLLLQVHSRRTLTE